MNATATFPLFPDLPRAGRPAPDAEPLRRRAGVEYFDLLTREILNRSDSARLPFDWTINPYRGCEFGCVYCYARATHAFLDLERPEDFENRIFVKRLAADRLRRELRKRDLRGQTIAIGTATDPYQPAEKRFEITRSLLEVFAGAEGLALAVTTKSPLALRDLDLFGRLDERHAVEIHVTLTTLDAPLARRLEPLAPDPAARLRLIERLAEAGLAVRVNCMPLMPGINDDEESLTALFEASRRAGAIDVVAQPIFFKGSTRDHFFGWLESERPALAPLYRRLYARGDYLSADSKDRVLTTFRRLRLAHGFPQARVGRP